MKQALLFASFLLVGLLLGLVLGFAVTTPRTVGISQVTVSTPVINGQTVLLVDSPEHPPWAQQHLTSVEFDYDHKTISILRYAVVISPGFRHGIYSRWPVVIRNGLLPGDYTLQIWGQDGFKAVGRVIASGTNVQYAPFQAEP